MGRGSSGKQSGRGTKPKASPPLYTTDADGARNYDTSEAGGKAFYALSDNNVTWNKGADISSGKELPQHVKRAQMWDYLKSKGMNEFILSIPEKRFMTEKKVNQIFKQLSDYGYYVVARRGENMYYVSKKSYQHLTLDFGTETVYKRGAKG